MWESQVGRKDGQPLPGEDEPLHAYVTATNPDSVKKAVEKIKEVIKQGIEVPEGQVRIVGAMGWSMQGAVQHGHTHSLTLP